MTARTVAVRVPATSANLGPGFDTLGLALSVYDELTVSALPDRRLEIAVSGEGADDVPTDDSHLVVRAIAHAYAAVGKELPGLRLTAHNAIPHGRGMGSSGAAVVAGLLAAKGLLAGEAEFGPDLLLRLATEMEGHPDNVAPALFGGLTIAWTGDAGPQHKKLLVHRGVSPLVFVPEFTMSTSVARGLAPLNVPREDAVFNVSRSALLIAALTQSPELLMAATEDKLHQSYRAQAMPATDALVQRLRAAGFAAVVSGAGPSVLVLADGPGQRREAVAIAAEADTPWEPLLLAVDVKGGTVRDYTEGSTTRS
ncbi:homoserine kinase [Microbacterium sp. TNHR37B]|uniref:homoserine kinase n=1 Tax=Microbacterium sp. TNHR37B TaxID=1775956 RepID=UPI0007B268F9|nr:homoserine kinase [Microbacterium sp. TNHR37B]KZE88937.1 Homoserine kinase [Microbacterium sp. TNHR37B]